ncbi:c-type cytochrome [Parasedimentitalea maritima]|uniref:C-type cytochrome n=1 Tax=Parasedimentitalea maritima TaxID=2578117 RepID=A0A6A4RF15_9RHOB|nr:cytochrome c family protein [Zongyanglinia marina]KAE9629326.1 c-type cytochrome [Zongyanglinia marina]
MRLSKLGGFALSTVLLIPSLSVAESAIDPLPTADLAKGEKAFKKCKACHTVDEGGKKKTGPNLFGIVGAPVAAADGFKYSKAMVGYGGEWTAERLNAFLTKPKAEIKGTKMSFSGLKKAKDRANLIAYLNSQSAAPLVFGAADAADAGDAADEEYEYGILFDAPGVEETFYACSACHSEMIVAQQGLTRDGWEELFEWMVEDQGAAEIDEPNRTIILDYLTAHYGEDRPNFPGKTN